LDFRLHASFHRRAAVPPETAGIVDRFAADTLPQFTILSLNETSYPQLAGVNTRYSLDFDDAYQFSVARENKPAIATQDKDFQRVRNVMNVRLL
jgi:predicted nucleic acid-binding protein